jgi:hypothetical protein
VPMLARRTLHMPRAQIGTRLHFGDGTTARVYRVTTVDREVREPSRPRVRIRFDPVRRARPDDDRPRPDWATIVS